MDSLDSVSLFDVIQAFIQADTWAASQRIIEAHPELLSDEGAFNEHRQLLARCRQVGAEAAFAERAREGGEIPSELGALLAALPSEQRQILLDAMERSESEDL
jgi:hypothetical protein